VATSKIPQNDQLYTHQIRDESWQNACPRDRRSVSHWWHQSACYNNDGWEYTSLILVDPGVNLERPIIAMWWCCYNSSCPPCVICRVVSRTQHWGKGLMHDAINVLKAKFHYAIQLETTSRAGLRSACELVADLLASRIV